MFWEMEGVLGKGLTVTLTGEAFAVLEVTQVLFDVKTRLTTSPLLGTKE